ncbi:hypothetical protein B296_00041047 [Ensete ventricosum]|uniref:Uncharacterized protein n=1 Tax=Ensete ventricosum TaxID=4639 RepID=A0A426XPQ2_ENSVE|nr:hypothetical protein B296_00041047 [Ensete ventricosum]
MAGTSAPHDKHLSFTWRTSQCHVTDTLMPHGRHLSKRLGGPDIIMSSVRCTTIVVKVQKRCTTSTTDIDVNLFDDLKEKYWEEHPGEAVPIMRPKFYWGPWKVYRGEELPPNM